MSYLASSTRSRPIVAVAALVVAVTVAACGERPRSAPATGSSAETVSTSAAVTFNPNSVLSTCVSPCTVTGRHSFDHPAWGPSVIVTTFSETKDFDREANILVLDRTGSTRWRYTSRGLYELALNSPARDSTGNLFINYNPGRYNGVIILRPTTSGFEDFRTLPPEDTYGARFYYAEIDTSGSVFSIRETDNDCNPTCAEAVLTHKTFTWNGTDYTAGD